MAVVPDDQDWGVRLAHDVFALEIGTVLHDREGIAWTSAGWRELNVELHHEIIMIRDVATTPRLSPPWCYKCVTAAALMKMFPDARMCVRDDLYIRPLPSYGQLMTREDFLDAVMHGYINSYDGSGHPVRDRLMSNQDAGETKLPDDCTHVMWFGK